MIEITEKLGLLQILWLAPTGTRKHDHRAESYTQEILGPGEDLKQLTVPVNADHPVRGTSAVSLEVNPQSKLPGTAPGRSRPRLRIAGDAGAKSMREPGRSDLRRPHGCRDRRRRFQWWIATHVEDAGWLKRTTL